MFCSPMKMALESIWKYVILYGFIDGILLFDCGFHIMGYTIYGINKWLLLWDNLVGYFIDDVRWDLSVIYGIYEWSDGIIKWDL